MVDSQLRTFTRIRVSSEGRHIDIAVPDDMSVAEVIRQSTRYLVPVEQQSAVVWALYRVDGLSASGGAIMQDLEVRDGDELFLGPLVDESSPRLVDDVAQQVAEHADSTEFASRPVVQWSVGVFMVVVSVAAAWVTGRVAAGALGLLVAVAMTVELVAASVVYRMFTRPVMSVPTIVGALLCGGIAGYLASLMWPAIPPLVGVSVTVLLVAVAAFAVLPELRQALYAALAGGVALAGLLGVFAVLGAVLPTGGVVDAEVAAAGMVASLALVVMFLAPKVAVEASGLGGQSDAASVGHGVPESDVEARRVRAIHVVAGLFGGAGLAVFVLAFVLPSSAAGLLCCWSLLICGFLRIRAVKSLLIVMVAVVAGGLLLAVVVTKTLYAVPTVIAFPVVAVALPTVTFVVLRQWHVVVGARANRFFSVADGLLLVATIIFAAWACGLFTWAQTVLS